MGLVDTPAIRVHIKKIRRRALRALFSAKSPQASPATWAFFGNKSKGQITILPAALRFNLEQLPEKRTRNYLPAKTPENRTRKYAPANLPEKRTRNYLIHGSNKSENQKEIREIIYQKKLPEKLATLWYHLLVQI